MTDTPLIIDPEWTPVVVPPRPCYIAGDFSRNPIRIDDVILFEDAFPETTREP